MHRIVRPVRRQQRAHPQQAFRGFQTITLTLDLPERVSETSFTAPTRLKSVSLTPFMPSSCSHLLLVLRFLVAPLVLSRAYFLETSVGWFIFGRCAVSSPVRVGTAGCVSAKSPAPSTRSPPSERARLPNRLRKKG